LPTLSLEKIHATITWYLHNKLQVDAYLIRLEEEQEKCYQEFQANPPAIVQKLKAEKAKRTGTKAKK
jgi:hypothetical protein